jgi:ABC-type Fe3+ transport system permease subunit
VTLALMETMNDVGASEFLGVQTLTLSIYSTWLTAPDLAGAAQIALRRARSRAGAGAHRAQRAGGT